MIETIEDYTDVEIGRKRVMRFLEDHEESNVQEFLNKFGDKPSYNGYEVLVWLGY